MYSFSSLKLSLLLVQSNKGIVKALLVTEDGNVASPNDDIDQLGVLANLQALIGLCTDISKYFPLSFTLFICTFLFPFQWRQLMMIAFTSCLIPQIIQNYFCGEYKKGFVH
jgi:hypothetical protein